MPSGPPRIAAAQPPCPPTDCSFRTHDVVAVDRTRSRDEHELAGDVAGSAELVRFGDVRQRDGLVDVDP